MAVSLSAPTTGQKIQSSQLTLTWTGAALNNDTTIELYYSNTYDQRWIPVRTGIRNSGSFEWDVSALRDGAFYRIYLINKKGNQIAFDSSAGFFTVDHVGDAAPEIALISPVKNRILSNSCIIQWAAADAEDDPVTITISKSEDGGLSYTEIATVANTGTYDLDTRAYANTTLFRLKVEAHANSKSAVAESPVCTIQNAFPALKDSVIAHATGRATGRVVPLVFDKNALTGHTYRVTFDSLNGKLIYTVVDQQTKVTEVAGDTLATFYGAGRLFDGIRLWFSNDAFNIDSLASGFVPSTVNLRAQVAKPTVGFYTPAPYDFRVTFTSLDTAADGRWITPGDSLKPTIGTAYVSCPFIVRNITDTTQIQFLVKDLGKKGRWDFGDELLALTPPPFRIAANNVMMGLTFFPPSITASHIILNAGDYFVARSKKSFTAGDVYDFIASSGAIGTGTEKSGLTPLTYELAQNYPNPFNPATMIRFSLPEAGRVHVQIFDVLGREVDQVVDEQLSAGTYQLRWNASHCSSGVYFVRMRVESPDGQARFVETRKAVYMR